MSNEFFNIFAETDITALERKAKKPLKEAF